MRKISPKSLLAIAGIVIAPLSGRAEAPRETEPGIEIDTLAAVYPETTTWPIFRLLDARVIRSGEFSAVVELRGVTEANLCADNDLMVEQHPVSDASRNRFSLSLRPIRRGDAPFSAGLIGCPAVSWRTGFSVKMRFSAGTMPEAWDYAISTHSGLRRLVVSFAPGSRWSAKLASGGQ